MEPNNLRPAPDEWIQPISEFTRTRQNLPHLQDPGAWYFTATNTRHREVLTDEERDIVFSAIRFHDGKKYDLDAAVVMQNHFHLILHPKEKGKGSYYSLPEIFHSIKSYSAQQIRKLRVGDGIPAIPSPDLAIARSVVDHPIAGGRDATSHAIRVWQDENYDHIIRNEKDYYEKLYYLIINPVEAGLVERAEDYRWLYYKGMPSQ